MKSDFYNGRVFTKYLVMLLACILLAKLYSLGIHNLLSGPKRMAEAEEAEMKSTAAISAGSQRIDWVDQLKAITFFFVIMGHTKITATVFGYTDGILGIQDVFKPIIYSFHMPMFFFLSGFTLNARKLQKNTYGSYLLKIAKSLLIPYALYNLVMFPAWVLLYKVLMPKDIGLLTVLRGIFVSNPMLEPMPSGALWFVTTLFIALALYVLIIKCTRDIKIIQFPIMVALALISYKTRGVNVVWHFNSALAAVVFVYMGSVFRRFYNLPAVQAFSKMKCFVLGCVLTVPAVYLWIRCIFYNGRVSMTANTYGLEKDSIIFFYLCAILGITIFVYWARLLPSSRFLTFIGKHTFFYMAVHTPIIYFLYYYIPDYMKNGPMLILIIFLIFIGIAPFAWICDKVCPYLEGKSYKDNLLINLGRYPVFFEIFLIPAYISFQYFAGESFADSQRGRIIICISLFVMICVLIDVIKYIRNQKKV